MRFDDFIQSLKHPFYLYNNYRFSDQVGCVFATFEQVFIAIEKKTVLISLQGC